MSINKNVTSKVYLADCIQVTTHGTGQVVLNSCCAKTELRGVLYVPQLSESKNP